MSRVRGNPERDAWLLAWLLTLVLHAVGFLVLRSLPQPDSAAATARPEPIQLVFERRDPVQRERDQPSAFTELPSDRADEAPEHADFLSNVTSRARDRVSGDDKAMPQLPPDAFAPMLKLRPDDRASAPPATSPPAAQRTGPPVPEQAGTSGTGPAVAGSGDPGAVQPRVEAPPREATGPAGTSDFSQPEMSTPDAGASPTGDISLNTVAWDYAPWLQRFSRKLMRRWIPPTAYTYGILKEGGWAVIDAEISRTGELLRLEVVEEHGHPSLAQADQIALHSIAPMEPLPADFPEPTLILRLRMIYPKIRPRP